MTQGNVKSLAEIVIGDIKKRVRKGFQLIDRCNGWIEEASDTPIDLGNTGENEHPIFSKYTRDKVEGILVHNPELTPLYFEREENSIPRIQYSPVQQQEELTEEEQTRLKMQMWVTIYQLYPPQEYLDTMKHVNEYFSQIKAKIRRTETIISIASAIPFPDIEDPYND